MDDKEPTQETQPKKGGAITIPVPTPDEVDPATSKVASPVPPKPSTKHRKRTEDAVARERARKRSGEYD